jgi:transposase
MRVWVGIESVDFRNGIEGLGAICRQRYERDPMNGHLFVFRNRTKKSLKILFYDGQGYWLCQKRLSAGKFKWWPTSEKDEHLKELLSRELQVLLWNGCPGKSEYSGDWKKVA